MLNSNRNIKKLINIKIRDWELNVQCFYLDKYIKEHI